MKRLFWKLKIEHNDEGYVYTVEKRNWVFVVYIIITFPIAVFLNICVRLNNSYYKPLNVYQKSITSNLKLDKKYQKKIFKQLISTDDE